MAAKIFMTVLGTHCRIGNHGTASYLEEKNEKGDLVPVHHPITVPDDVATELEAEIAGLKGERDEKGQLLPGKVDQPGRTDIRVERAVQASAPAKPTPAPAMTAAALKDAQKGKGEE